MISFSLVDVKDITSNIKRSSFTEADLNHLAEIILESGGLIRPLVLKVTGVESFTVVDGHFEYYAAVRAREKDPRKGEMINALVIPPKSENTIVKQAEALKSAESHNDTKITENSTGITSLETRLANIELRFEKQIDELRSEQIKERRRVDDKLKEIEEQIPKQIEPLEAFNTLSLTELIPKLKRAGFAEAKAAQIANSVESERKKKKFESLSSVVSRVKITTGQRQVKGISSDKMIDIVDIWTQL